MGTDTQPYLNGKRVYRGGSNAPSRGANNPQGYVQRELGKRGQSQNRSGKASALLRAKEQISGQNERQQASNNQQPVIPDALTPVGNTGIYKDPTGRLHYGGSPQAPTQQGPPGRQETQQAPRY